MKNLLLLVLLLSGAGFAQADEPVYIAVDILVFARGNDVRTVGERWDRSHLVSDLSGTRDPEDLQGVWLLRQPSDNAGTAGQAPQTAFRPGAFPGTSPLDHAYRKLSSSGEFRILTRRWWVQPLADEAAPRVRIHDGLKTIEAGEIALPIELDGFIHIYRKQHGQVQISLRFRPSAMYADKSARAGSFPRPGDSATLRSAGAPRGTTFALEQRRRFRSEELHYFDHPRFGALLWIERVTRAPKPNREVLEPVPGTPAIIPLPPATPAPTPKDT
ncbi:MAG: peptidoglycan binding protein CsiV [Gammaproteobacteria bacterium]|nr:peptidoglycan binding protein CsiV [Gammaproteobacteria bacterium]